ncbi:MAG: SEC-C metal-binding domain-containing protein [Terriglobia bacterium]
MTEWFRKRGSCFSAPKLGPDDYCPCGSGKKFKKCCGVA